MLRKDANTPRKDNDEELFVCRVDCRNVIRCVEFQLSIREMLSVTS